MRRGKVGVPCSQIKRRECVEHTLFYSILIRKKYYFNLHDTRKIFNNLFYYPLIVIIQYNLTNYNIVFDRIVSICVILFIWKIWQKVW